MSARVLDGAATATAIREALAPRIASFTARHGRAPGLAIVLAGENPASEIYVRSKLKSAGDAGCRTDLFRLPTTASLDQALATVRRLNADETYDGILVQSPLPDGMGPHAEQRVFDTIDPAKDVDGFHPVNVGRLSTGTGGMVPCTPLGVMMLLDTVIDDFVGLDAVVIGKSNIVGKPVALMLLDRECTVTVTHIYTENLPEIARKADIIVAAAGAPELVKGDWVKPGAVLIDVGITRIMGDDGKEKLVGDIAFDEVQHAKAVTPVPGGVGPMTIACLLHNTVQAVKTMVENGDANGHDPYHDAPDRSLIYGTSESGA
jgi:methylenetetrahydrofolate dehydrogenase (NADP+)/methenyltetrahydrofolate cyclohydrolase